MTTAYLLAEMRTDERTGLPVLHAIGTYSEDHNTITRTRGGQFYATIAHADGKDYDDACKNLKKLVKMYHPELGQLVWANRPPVPFATRVQLRSER